MADKVSTSDLIEMVHAQSEGFTKSDIKSVVTSFLGVTVDTLQSGRDLELRGLGTFKVKDRVARVVRSNVDGKEYQVPKRKAIRYQVAKGLKEALRK